MRRFVYIVFAFWGCLVPEVAQAATTCTVTGTTVAFGTVNPFGSNVTSSGTITVVCRSGAANATYTIALSTGAGSFATRTMKSGSNALDYNLYTSSAYTSIWGDGTSGTATVTGTGENKTNTFTVYGKLPLPQGVAPASYSDTITVTVTY